jgi:hypothetical protein
MRSKTKSHRIFLQASVDSKLRNILSGFVMWLEVETCMRVCNIKQNFKIQFWRIPKDVKYRLCHQDSYREFLLPFPAWGTGNVSLFSPHCSSPNKLCCYFY